MQAGRKVRPQGATGTQNPRIAKAGQDGSILIDYSSISLRRCAFLMAFCLIAGCFYYAYFEVITWHIVIAADIPNRHRLTTTRNALNWSKPAYGLQSYLLQCAPLRWL